MLSRVLLWTKLESYQEPLTLMVILCWSFHSFMECGDLFHFFSISYFLVWEYPFICYFIGVISFGYIFKSYGSTQIHITYSAFSTFVLFNFHLHKHSSSKILFKYQSIPAALLTTKVVGHLDLCSEERRWGSAFSKRSMFSSYNYIYEQRECWKKVSGL